MILGRKIKIKINIIIRNSQTDMPLNSPYISKYLWLSADYIDGKRDFPWELRLSIASGIASGFNFIYQSSDNQEIIPHGNLKLSNILLDENNKALISE